VPVIASNDAQAGLLAIENVSVPPRGLDAVGVNVYACPATAVSGGVPEIVGGAGAVATTVAVAVPVFVESCDDTAVIVTAACAGTVAGAVYRPLDEIVPTVELPPATPLTCQVTVVSVALLTVAWNACVPVPATTAAVAGVTATDTGGAVGTSETEALADALESAADTAVMVIVEDEGIDEGD
jgi:hypothetical protein